MSESQESAILERLKQAFAAQNPEAVNCDLNYYTDYEFCLGAEGSCQRNQQLSDIKYNCNFFPLVNFSAIFFPHNY
jgi:hypothetical protein